MVASAACLLEGERAFLALMTELDDERSIPALELPDLEHFLLARTHGF